MRLEKFKGWEVQKGEPIAGLDAGVIYFVHNGRNAWHNTWSQRYTPDCMYLNRSRAESFCEEKRTNGSVFYIIETPALVAMSNYGKLIVTQVNAIAPLSGYELIKWPAGFDEKLGETKCRTPLTIDELVESFKEGSGHWNHRPDDAQPVLAFWLFDAHAEVDGLPNRPLTTFRSYSNGSKFRLGWSKVERTRSQAAVLKIVNDYILSPKDGKVTNSFYRRRQEYKSVEEAAYRHCAAITRKVRGTYFLLDVVRREEKLFEVTLGIWVFRVLRIGFLYTVDDDGNVVSVEKMGS